MHFGEISAEDHFSCSAAHLEEISRQCSQTTKNKLIKRKIIIADKTHILSDSKTTGGHIAYQFREPAVKPASRHEKQIFLTNDRRNLFQYIYWN